MDFDPSQTFPTPTTNSFLSSIYGRTAAEVSAGVTPTLYYFPPGNVLRYGAKGDFNGTTGTDDTAAIQAAINVAQAATDPGTYGSFTPYLGVNTVYFPSGSYKVTAALTASKRITLMGEGASEFSSGTRLIQTTANTDLIAFDAVASGTSFSIENMTLESLSSLVGGTGILLNVKRTTAYTNSQVYRQVTFANPQDVCAKLIGDDILIEGGRIDVARKGFQLGTTTAAESASNVRIIGVDFFQVGNSGANAWVTIQNAVNVTLSACQGQTVSGQTALAVVDAKTVTPFQCSNVIIDGCKLKNARSLVLASGINGLNVTGNEWDTFGVGAGETNSIIDLFGVCTNVSITGNNSSGTQDTANHYKDTSATSVTNLIITGNNFINAGGSGDAINCTKATNAIVWPNTFSGFSRNITAAAGQYLAIGLPLNSLTNVTYSASMQFDCSLAGSFRITATNGSAFTIQDPLNGSTGQRIRITIRNTSGGALGALTLGGSYKIGAAWTQPATGFSRSIEFENDGTNYVERNRTAADVAN